MSLKTLGAAAMLCAAVSAVAPLSAPRAVEARRPVVVELFTSQGCSSCPPADALLAELADREDVVALSLHVDYWDYIGWKDPFAQAAFTERQRDYTRSLGLRYVYTPQMVIHGAADVRGSDRPAVLSAIGKAANRLTVEIARVAPDKVTARIVAGEGESRAGPASVWMALYDPRHDTEVKRGENIGRRIVNRNVVREMRRIGTWAGQALTLSETVPPGVGVAVVVQERVDDAPGPILGAAKLPPGG